MIVFTSDNGFFFGEHALSAERRLPYEESIRAPLLVRYPPGQDQTFSCSPLVSALQSVGIDFAPKMQSSGGYLRRVCRAEG